MRRWVPAGTPSWSTRSSSASTSPPSPRDLTFAQRAGLDVEQLVPALQAGWASSTVLGVKAPQILDRAFDRPIGTVAVQHKDLRYINDTAAELGMELPFSSRLLGMYDELLAEGKAGLDQMALIELFERAAGVTVQRRSPPA
ncbi:MAG: NAD-binding protein [Acidimicrobiales bacterium]